MNEAVIDHFRVYKYYISYVSEGNKNINFKFKINKQEDETTSLLTLYATGGKIYY